MGNHVKIGAQVYRFKSVHGHQIVNGQECSVLRDDDDHTVTISDSLPLDCQLAEASRETTKIMAEQAAPHEAGLGTVDGLPSLPSFGKINARS